MSRTDRLLQILQILRRHRRPVTGQTIAEELEISLRTLYRDMNTLTISGVPITGEAGIGYVLGHGFDLPPLMFNEAELEAIMLGARMVEDRGDRELARAAQDVVAKVSAILPDSLKPVLLDAALMVANFSPPLEDRIDPVVLRKALREARRIEILYSDERNVKTRRVIWPLAIGYLNEKRILVSWCESREDFRHFRTDRIVELNLQDTRFRTPRAVMLKRWELQELERRNSPRDRFRPDKF
ncbi:MAG: YafY family transcriptional regulator [Fimbriimonadaceae bacterium]|nr:YafY family transcriptional regulator [Alphaproteobacteria bacterium]